jgi:hypothetical protein
MDTSFETFEQNWQSMSYKLQKKLLYEFISDSFYFESKSKKLTRKHLTTNSYIDNSNDALFDKMWKKINRLPKSTLNSSPTKFLEQKTTNIFERKKSFDINSDYFKSKHHIVMMNQIKKFSLQDFAEKQVMTFGLGGCTAFIVVSITTKNVMLGHVDAFDSSQSRMINEIKQFLSNNSDCEIIIKAPEEYKKNNEGKWETVLKRKSFYEKSFPTHQLTFIPYSTSHFVSDEYNSSLFIKYDKDTQTYSYTDNYGSYINI